MLVSGPSPGTRAPHQHLVRIVRHGRSTFGEPGVLSFGFALSEELVDAVTAWVRALPAATSRG